MAERTWRCVVCGKKVTSGVVFAAVKDTDFGIVVGDCCAETVNGRIMDPRQVFIEQVLLKMVAEDKQPEEVCRECDKRDTCPDENKKDFCSGVRKAKAQVVDDMVNKAGDDSGFPLPPWMDMTQGDTVH